MTAAPVLLETPAPHVALVTLNRPEARNAINGALAQALEAAVDRVEGDDAIRVAILTGAGPIAFCAGADLKEVAGGVDGRQTARGGLGGFVRAPRAKPWIAAAQGHALAGGLELLLACDFALAAEHATFGLPEVKRSLVAASGGMFRLPRAIPRGLALEMIATGEAIPAARALAAGLVNAVHPAGELLPAAIALAQRIAANAPLAVRESLAIARQAQALDEAALWELSAAARARIRQTEDFREGPRAFIEKRPPRWVGR